MWKSVFFIICFTIIAALPCIAQEKPKDKEDSVDEYLDHILAEPMRLSHKELQKDYVNQPVFDFTATAIDGKTYRLSSLRDKLIIISFWATWCRPCVREMPILVELQARYRSRGLQILFVNGDEDQNAAQQFLKTHLFNFPVFLPTPTNQKAFGQYFNHAIPLNIFIDSHGTLRYAESGVYPGMKALLTFVVEDFLPKQ